MRTARRGTLSAVIASGVVLAIITACLSCGVVVVITTQGAGQSPASIGDLRGPAVPLAWRLVEFTDAARCEGLSWSVLGALGWLVDRSGRESLHQDPPWWPWPGGAFGIDPADASFGLVRAASDAATTLCRDQAQAGSLTGALIALTGQRSAALEIEVVATSLAEEPSLGAGQAGAVAFAAGALGLPYQWGGNGPGSYDCSGLVVAAFRSVGVALPRTAQEQYDATSPVAGPGAPGDLVFFGDGPDGVEHVGIDIGDGLMIDAPHTGAFVRIEPDGWADLVARHQVS